MSSATAVNEFVPASLDATDWANIAPFYAQLAARDVQSAQDLERLILDRSMLDSTTGEAEANLYIEMTRHTDDPAVQQAYASFVTNVDPHMRKAAFELDQKIVRSSFAQELPTQRYAVYLRNLAVDVELFRPENVAIQTELSQLDQRYSQINGAMTVQFNGKEHTMAEMGRYFEDPDRALREAAWRATQARRAQNRAEVDAIYDEMLAKRHVIAKNAGFDNFRDFQHRRYKRFDYTSADCKRFQDSIADTLVPLQRKIHDERANALGITKLRPWDLAVDPQGRPPLRPFNDAARLYDGCGDMYRRMDAELSQMYASLAEGDCLDLASRKGKAPGGYQYQRQRSGRPFIFMNAAGVHRDLVTMVHEAGHAFHSLLCANDPLVDYRNAPMEFAEVASMSQELLTLPFLSEFYTPEECQRAERDRLEKFPTLMPWIATIDAFQHWTHTHPGHTVEERRAAWRELDARFGGDCDWSGLEETRDSMWQRQLHLFGAPFYYIEYGIAELGAMQMWMQSRRDTPLALANYKKALALGGSRPLPELFETAGIRLDLSAPMMRELAHETERALEALPV